MVDFFDFCACFRLLQFSFHSFGRIFIFSYGISLILDSEYVFASCVVFSFGASGENVRAMYVSSSEQRTSVTCVLRSENRFRPNQAAILSIFDQATTVGSQATGTVIHSGDHLYHLSTMTNFRVCVVVALAASVSAFAPPASQPVR
jgi:hypothetical protein